MTAQIIHLADRRTLRTRAYLQRPAPVSPDALALAALVWWAAVAAFWMEARR